MSNIWSNKANWLSQSHFSWFKLLSLKNATLNSYKWNEKVLKQCLCLTDLQAWLCIISLCGLSKGKRERWKERWKGGMLNGGEREERNKRELRFLVLAVFLRQKMLEQQSRCPGSARTDEKHRLCLAALYFYPIWNALH